ncbi:MAG: deaminase [Candidatus Saccharibacteria bacterium]
MTKQVLLYMPVIHRGYETLLERHSDATEILVLGTSFSERFPQLSKDIRALDPDRIVRMARLIIPGTHIRVVESYELGTALFARTKQRKEVVLVMPDEDIMHELVEVLTLEEGRDLYFESAYLRWDRSRAEAEREVEADEEISQDDFHLHLVQLARSSSERSHDWWRQVGAALWKDGALLYEEHNHHLPSDYTAVIEGDPRSSYRGGVRTDLSLANHAEAVIIGTAARDGVSLDGATIAVNTFPCPGCARLIITAGIREIIFETGYALLEGDDLLRRAGVKIIRVAPN